MAEDVISLFITEESKLACGWRVKLAVEKQQWTANLLGPMVPEEQERLRWSLEEHALRSPFETQKCGQSLKELGEYGRRLFDGLQLRGHVPKLGRQTRVVINVAEAELHSGFQQIIWEVLEDPSLWSDGCEIIEVRRMFATKPSKGGKFFGNFSMLYVVARSWQDRDMFIDHRLISSSLVQTLHEARPSSVQVDLDIVRPGTWSALVDHLEKSRVIKGRGYYDMVHFDMHGGVEKEAEQESYYFEFNSSSNPGVGEPISSASVARLLRQHRIRVAVLNTCESANARVDGSANLAKSFMKHGVKTVVAMSYKLSISAAKIFFNTFYLDLFSNGLQYTAAATHGRKALRMNPARCSRFGLSVPIHDWIVPVCYVDEHQPSWRMHPTKAGHSFLSIPFTKGMHFRFSPEEKKLASVLDAESITGTTPWQVAPYIDEPGDLIGRDWEILRMEYQLTQAPNTILLLSGPPGVGKTALARRLVNWWIRTRFASYVSYVSYAAEDFVTRLDGWITKNATTSEPERFGMPWIYIIDDIESDVGAFHQDNSIRLDQLVSLIKKLASHHSKFLLISRQHLLVFRESKLVSRLQKSGYHVPEFQLPGLSYAEAANFGAAVLEGQGVHLDSASQSDIPYLEKLYELVDRLPGGIEWVLRAVKSEPGFFRTRLHQLQHPGTESPSWPRVGALYTQLFDMEGNGKQFMLSCLVAYAAFPISCPSQRHWELYIYWLIWHEPDLFPRIEVSEHSIQRQRDHIRQHEQFSDRDLGLEREDDIKAYLRFIDMWDNLRRTRHLLEQYGLVLEAETNIGLPTWIHPGLRHILRKIQCLDVAALREPPDRAFSFSIVRSHLQTYRRDQIFVEKQSTVRPSALDSEKTSLIRKDVPNYLKAAEIGQSLVGQSFNGEIAFTFNGFAQFLEDVMAALNTNRYEIELRALQEIGRKILSEFISTKAVLETDNADAALSLLTALHGMQGYQLSTAERLDLKMTARTTISLCNNSKLSVWATGRLWLVKGWFSTEELSTTSEDGLEKAFGEYNSAREIFRRLGITRPQATDVLFRKFEAYRSAFLKYSSIMAQRVQLVPLNGHAELEDRLLRSDLQLSKAEDRLQVFAYARCLNHENDPEQIERCYRVELLRLEGKYGEARDHVADGLDNALRADNQAGEYDFTRYLLETTDSAPGSVVAARLRNINRLEELFRLPRCCPCWYPAVQADIALRVNRPENLLKLSLDALSNAVFECKVWQHVYRAFEYLEHASVFLLPGMTSFIGLCLPHMGKDFPFLGDLGEFCQRVFRPHVTAAGFRSGNVWAFNKAPILETAILVGLPEDHVLEILFRLCINATIAACQQSMAAGTEFRKALSEAMEAADKEALGRIIKEHVTFETFASWATVQVKNSERERKVEDELDDLGFCGIHLASNTFALTKKFELGGEIVLMDAEGHSYPLATTVAIRPGPG